jgi:hypothetical protein
MTDHYRRPGWFTRNLANRLMKVLTKLGISVKGSRVLETKGRKSGLPRQVPVNLLVLDGVEYLVAPRGTTEWVRNVRADGGRLTLILKNRRDDRRGVELPDGDKTLILREYLRRWQSEVKVFFDGVGPESTDAEIAAIADRHPVFQLSAG